MEGLTKEFTVSIDKKSSSLCAMKVLQDWGCPNRFIAMDGRVIAIIKPFKILVLAVEHFQLSLLY